MKKKYLNINIPGRFCALAVIACACAHSVRAEDDGEKPVNPDLDAKNIKFITTISRARQLEDGSYVSTFHYSPYLVHKLGRNPQPKNEWIYRKYEPEKYVDGPGWVKDTFGIDSTVNGTFEFIHRGRMEFRGGPVGYRFEEAYTLSSQIFLKIVDPEDMPD